MFAIEICDRQTVLVPNLEQLKQAVAWVLEQGGVAAATVSIALVDDAEMHQLNRQYLEHDYPTDVLSFLLEREDDRLEGEVIASTDTAARSALVYDWPAEAELLLYVIHGTLHLVGHEDADEPSRAAMRAAEGRCLAQFGWERRGEDINKETGAD